MEFLEKASLRTKVLVPVTAVMVLLLAVTVFIVNQRFKQQFEESSRRQLDAAKLRFQHEQLNHLNQLNFRFQSLAREPKYFAAFRTLNPNTIQKQLAAMVENEDLAKEGVAKPPGDSTLYACRQAIDRKPPSSWAPLLSG